MEVKPHYTIFMRTVVPLPVFPSKVNRLAIGGSRPPKALRMSCPSIPPTIAQTGENSWLAMVASDLREGTDEMTLRASEMEHRTP